MKRSSSFTQMTRKLVCGAGVLALASLAHSGEESAPPSTPKTLILGFDGLDHSITTRLMGEGRLPNLQRLAARGSMQALDTSAPAQSPVSWAVFNTGTNPGAFGVGGFVARYFKRDKHGERVGTPLPKAMLGDSTTIELPTPLKGLPRATPYEINPMQGTNWWSYLDAAGVRFMGIQVASSFPPDREGQHTHLLAGLGLKDIGGSPGSWSIYTDDPWSLEKGTGSGGKIRKLYFDKHAPDGREEARTTLRGPRNWVIGSQWEARLAAATQAVEQAPSSSAEHEAAQRELKQLQEDYKNWKRQNEWTSAPLKIRKALNDPHSQPIEFLINEQSVKLSAGEWSAPILVSFALSAEHSEHGVLFLHLIANSDDEMRFYVSPIQLDPTQPPAYVPLSSPPEFVSELANSLGGPFPTLGWAAPTNAYKDKRDTKFDSVAFMSGVSNLLSAREALLDAGLARADEWDVYFQIFSAADRVSHMTFRDFDPGHPAHDAELSSRVVSAFGESFPLSDAIPQTYVALDRIVGKLLDRIDAGEFGRDALLLVLSDHGFQSFRHGVNLNNLLLDAGFMSLSSNRDGSPGTLEQSRRRGLLGFVDWPTTQAYSMGLGKIFLNLEGREPTGSVKPEEVATLIEELKRALLNALDANGTPLITSVETRDDLFSGPWVHENEAAVYQVAHEQRTEAWDGFADLFVGFAPTYRIAWNATMGGLDERAVMINANNWSGGHVSVDPQHVRGVLFSSAAFDSSSATPNLLDIGPTILVRHGLDPQSTPLEGRQLRFEK